MKKTKGRRVKLKESPGDSRITTQVFKSFGSLSFDNSLESPFPFLSRGLYFTGAARPSRDRIEARTELGGE